MSSRARRRPKSPTGKPRSLLAAKLERIRNALSSQGPEAALPLAEEAAVLFPNIPEVLELLSSLYAEKGEIDSLEQSAFRWAELAPDNPKAQMALAAAHANNSRIGMAARVLEQFPRRWPNHEFAEEARELLEGIRQDVLPAFTEAFGLDPDRALTLACLLERSQFFLDVGRDEDADRTIRKAAELAPNQLPVLLTQAAISIFRGQFSRAEEALERALVLDPDSFYTLENLVRVRALQGDFTGAEEAWERLRPLEPATPDDWGTQATAAAFLGRDQEVVALLERTGDPRDHPDWAMAPEFFHLAAVACFRLGDEKRARRLWQEIVRIDPSFTPAEDILKDLDLPPGRRYAPWAFPHQLLLPPSWLDSILALLSVETEPEVVERMGRRMLREFPQLRGMVRVLLLRGDPLCVELALLAAQTLSEPEIGAALREFALDRWRPDGVRFRAATRAIELGAMEPGVHQMWVDGRQQELMLLGIEIHGDITNRSLGKAQQAYMEAAEAIRERDLPRAEEWTRKALQVRRNDPTLLYTLGLVRRLQGNEEEAEALTQQAHEIDPDYLFARTALAAAAAAKGQVERGHELLQPVMRRKRMHFSEFDAVCSAQVQLLQADHQWEAARQWLEIWKALYPDSPNLPVLEAQMPAMLTGRFAKTRRAAGK